VEIVEIVTTGTAHATELMQNLSSEDMQSYDGVVGVGGDGILYEIIAGFMI
jgi:diacylglycerol kinase family enzyme